MLAFCYRRAKSQILKRWATELKRGVEQFAMIQLRHVKSSRAMEINKANARRSRKTRNLESGITEARSSQVCQVKQMSPPARTRLSANPRGINEIHHPQDDGRGMETILGNGQARQRTLSTNGPTWKGRSQHAYRDTQSNPLRNHTDAHR